MHRFLYLILLGSTSLFGDVSAVYLSWYGDPTSTMTVQWHTPPGESDLLQLEMPDKTTLRVTGTSHPFANQPVLVHTVTLSNLTPDTEYAFRIGEAATRYLFKTAPKTLDQPLRFVIGGDLYHAMTAFRTMSQTVASQDPLFAVLGGDIAYAENNPGFFAKAPAKQWLQFLAEWTKIMKSPSGRLIPFLLVPGNHDIRPKDGHLFFSLFAFPEKVLYRAVDFGSYLSLILLDSGHFSPIAGAQTSWLDEALSKRANRSYVFPVYHVGAYPSFYAYTSGEATSVRTHWCPLFDQYGIKAAFENHSHTYKKTFPIKGETLDPDGTVYFGDGAWGVKTRRTHGAWYLEKTGSKNHVYLIEMTQEAASIQAIDLYGNILDKASVASSQLSNNQ